MITRTWYNRDCVITLAGGDWSDKTIELEFLGLANQLHKKVFNFDKCIYDKPLPEDSEFPLTKTYNSPSGEVTLTIELNNWDAGNLVCALCEIWEGHSKPEIEKTAPPESSPQLSGGTGIYELATYLEELDSANNPPKK